MKEKDFVELQAVSGFYPMAYYFNELLGETHDDLPDMIDSSNLRNCLKDFISQLEKYQYKVRDTFLNACDDKEKANESEGNDVLVEQA